MNYVEDVLDELNECLVAHSYDPAWGELDFSKARPILKRLLAEREAETVEQLAQCSALHRGSESVDGYKCGCGLAIAIKLRALSPDPNFMERERLKAKLEDRRSCGFGTVDLDRQLAALPKPEAR